MASERRWSTIVASGGAKRTAGKSKPYTDAVWVPYPLTNDVVDVSLEDVEVATLFSEVNFVGCNSVASNSCRQVSAPREDFNKEFLSRFRSTIGRN